MQLRTMKNVTQYINWCDHLKGY